MAVQIAAKKASSKDSSKTRLEKKIMTSLWLVVNGVIPNLT